MPANKNVPLIQYKTIDYCRKAKMPADVCCKTWWTHATLRYCSHPTTLIGHT